MMVVSTLARSSSGSVPPSNLTLSDKVPSLFKYDELKTELDSSIHQVGPSSPACILHKSASNSCIQELVIVSSSKNMSSDSESELLTEKVRQRTPLLVSVSLDSEISPSIEIGTNEVISPVKTLPLKLRLLNSIRNMTWQSGVRLLILTLLLGGIITFLGFLIGSNHVQTSMVEVLGWLSKLPKWAGSLLMIAMYTVALLFFCPGTPFNLAAGFLFGIWIGIGVAMAGCMLGAGFAFLLGRTIARDWIKGKMEQRPKFKAVDWAIQKNGIYIVFLTRLSPLFPFPLLNYGFGITKVEVWKYVLGTFAGVVPATVAYTYLGTLMRDLTDIWTATNVSNEEGGKKTNLYWLIGGAVMTVISIVVISLITKRAISKATREYELQNSLKEAETVRASLEDVEPPHVELEEIISEES